MKFLLAVILLLPFTVFAEEETLKTTPSMIWLFVLVVTPTPDDPRPYQQVYRSEDHEACEKQAEQWSKLLAPSVFKCLPHRQKALKGY